MKKSDGMVIVGIEEVHDFKIQPVAPMNRSNGSRLGLSQMLSSLGGYSAYDGYKVTTDQHTYLVLIDNGQSCCESWGYMSSDDDLARFIGANLLAAEATDTALNKKRLVEEVGGGWRTPEEPDFDGGGVQFVDFKTDRGTFQLAVYNAHNGYYGHGILFARDNEIVIDETL